MKDMVLRPITLEDYESVLRWSKDDVFCTANGWELNRDPRELLDWWKICVKSNSDSFVRMGIEFQQQLIGYVDLAEIQRNEAELGIAIGERNLWGNGLGYHASRNMIDYGSEKLGITRFLAETHEINTRSRRMLEKLGFNEISRVGHDIYMDRKCRLIQYRLTM